VVLGRFAGPAYPFGPSPALVLGPKPDANVILSSICNIITTPKGSVPYNPKLGSRVPYLLFDINDEVTQGLVRYYTLKDVSEQDPRAIINRVTIDVPVDGHTIIVLISFSIAGDALGQVHSAPVYFPRVEG
jgi:phage baseplate assembly protein W